jgi:two-component system alkaline phosphatase synthesis response regulator PhoP
MPKIKILVIEDDPEIVKLMTYILTKQGYEVESARNGVEGMDKAVSFQPRLILLDVNMPEIDGMQVLELLKGSPETSRISVIMCTACASIDDVGGALGIGADGYLVKPVVAEKLLSKIKEVLNTQKIL